MWLFAICAYIVVTVLCGFCCMQLYRCCCMYLCFFCSVCHCVAVTIRGYINVGVCDYMVVCCVSLCGCLLCVVVVLVRRAVS